MRLTEREVEAIRNAAVEAFGAGPVIRLFGSRLDDNRRGGDIDLHIQVAHAVTSEQKASFRRSLVKHVGDREYDVVILSSERTMSAIDRKALAEGAVL